MQEMNRDEIQGLLAEGRIGRLCMAGADGKPYAIPLPFTWLDDSLYVRLPMTGRKGQVLSENDQVCFEADEYTDSLDAYSSVLIEGVLQEVTDLQEKARVRSHTQAKYSRLRGGHRPGHGRVTPLRELAMQKIVVRQISGRKKDAQPTLSAVSSQ